MPPDAITRDPVLDSLYRYWNSRRVDGRPPPRDSVDPLDIPRHVLPHLLLVELEGEPPRIRYRLVGTAISARYGEDFTGRYLDEVSGPDYRDLLDRLYRQMQRTAQPVYVESLFHPEPGVLADTHRLYLPLTVDGAVTMALSAQVFPAYPFDARGFFQLIRDRNGNAADMDVVHREWLVDPDTGTMTELLPPSATGAAGGAAGTPPPAR